MKRWIALLLTLCVAGCLCFVFAGCDSDEPAASSVAASSKEAVSEDPGEDIDPIPVDDPSEVSAASSQKPATSSVKPATSSQKPATSSVKPATSSQKPASSSKATSSKASSSKATSSKATSSKATSSKATSSQKTVSGGGIDLPIDWF